MNIVFYLFMSLCLVQPSIKDVRQAFQKAHESQESAKAFNDLMQKDMVNIDTNLKEAYLGASEVILADYEKGLSNKVKTFKTGRNHIEHAIKQNSNNIELRFIRLIMQNKVPKILNYHNQIISDKSFILSNIKEASKDLKTYIKTVNRELKLFSEEEIQSLN